MDSLSESTGNSQPGPPTPKARCGTGFESSNAGAVKRERSWFDLTFSFTRSGTGSNGSIAVPSYGSGNLTEWGENQALVDELRAKLHADYDGIVLCDEALHDPPVRGPHCEARIYVKPGAEPKK